MVPDPPEAEPARSNAGLWRARATRVPLFAGLWVVVTGTDPAAWLIGIPAVLLAAWAVERFGPGASWPLSLTGALRFIAYFMRESLRGGLDVAARTLGPRLRIAPGFLTYRCRLPAGRPRVLFANCVSLLPGTLTAELIGAELAIHLLDANAPAQDDLARLEEAIARLFALPTESRHA